MIAAMMTLAPPVAYGLAFLFFAAALVFFGRLPPLRFPVHEGSRSPGARAAFWAVIGAYLVFQIAAVFDDPNFGSQEGAMVENMSQLYSAESFFHSYRPHQLLYNGIVFVLARAFGILDLDGIVLLGRSVSAGFMLAGALFFWRFLYRFEMSDRARLAALLLFLFNPLAFFYAGQAECYAMLAFAAAASSYFFFSIDRSPGHVVGFAATFLVGYFTHLMFVLVLAAQMLFAAWFLVVRRRSLREFYGASILILPVLFALRSQITKIPDSGGTEFLDGYFPFDARIAWDQLLSFFGLIDLPFGIGRVPVYLASGLFALWCAVSAFRGRRNPAVVYLVFFAGVHFPAVIAYIVSNMQQWAMFVARHYIAVVAPLMILACLTHAPARRLSPAFLLDQSRGVLFAAVLFAFLATDASFLTRHYRVDGRAARAYLEKLGARERLICVGLTGWSIGVYIHPSVYLLREEGFEKPDSGDFCKSFTYYRTEYVDKRNENAFYFRPEEFGAGRRAPSALVEALVRDGIAAAPRGRDALGFLNRLVDSPEATRRLQEMAGRRDLTRFPAKLLRPFAPIPWRTQYHNRVLVEFLYPALAPQNWYPKFDRKGKILAAIQEQGKPGDRVAFFHTREQLLGIEYVDQKIQDEHLAFMYAVPRLRFERKASFNNIDVYLFRLR